MQSSYNKETEIQRVWNRQKHFKLQEIENDLLKSRLQDWKLMNSKQNNSTMLKFTPTRKLIKKTGANFQKMKLCFNKAQIDFDKFQKVLEKQEKEQQKEEQILEQAQKEIKQNKFCDISPLKKQAMSPCFITHKKNSQQNWQQETRYQSQNSKQIVEELSKQRSSGFGLVPYRTFFIEDETSKNESNIKRKNPFQTTMYRTGRNNSLQQLSGGISLPDIKTMKDNKIYQSLRNIIINLNTVKNIQPTFDDKFP